MQTVYWLVIDNDIDDCICHCRVCIQSKPSHPSSRTPNKPQSTMRFMAKTWHHFSCWNNPRYYMLITDCFWKVPFLIPVNSLSLKTTEIQLCQMLSTEGVPREVSTCNRPPSAVKISLHSFINGDSHTISSPLCPQYNGVRVIHPGIEKMPHQGQNGQNTHTKVLLHCTTCPWP